MTRWPAAAALAAPVTPAQDLCRALPWATAQKHYPAETVR